MTTTLRDQLLGLGFKSAPKPERKPERKPDPKRDARQVPRQDRNQKPGAVNRPQLPRSPRANPTHAQGKPPRSREDIDLAKAYAIRAQREKDERIEAERVKQEEARQRREAKAKLSELLAGKGLNAADAEHVRHFEYGGKIKRIHVTAEQLKALNAGDLGVVQLDGRYLLVDAAMLALAEATFPPAVALKVDPKAAAGDDPYADPQYQVPDDLIW
ncbi:MAG: DUF2058 family protein [Pseudomonadota bacterium]